MALLIDDLLDLSRVTRSSLSRQMVDLSALAREIAAEIEKSQPDRRVRFVIADGLAVRGDPRLLRVLLENLLGNAFKFTQKEREATIEFGAVTRDGGVATTCATTGSASTRPTRPSSSGRSRGCTAPRTSRGRA